MRMTMTGAWSQVTETRRGAGAAHAVRVAITARTALNNRKTAITCRPTVADPVASFATPIRQGPRYPAR